MDENACNFDTLAWYDDEDCDYTSCAGCTDFDACNFDVEATIDDNSCEYPSSEYVNCDEDCLDECDCYQQVEFTPVDITSLRFTQRDWHLEDEVIENTSWGRVHLGYFPIDETHFVNVVAQDVSQEDVWIVQNWPLFYVDNDVYDERFKAVDFNLQELGYEEGEDCNEITYSITITPDQFTAPSPVDDWSTCPVLPLEYRVLPYEQDTWPIPFEPGEPVGCKGDGEVEKLSGDRDIKPVQEGYYQCFAGSMARSIDWLNRKYNLGSDKTAQQIYDGLRADGVGDLEGIDDLKDALLDWLPKKDQYASTLTDNKVITTVWDSETAHPWVEGEGYVPPMEGIDEETGDFLEWLIQDLKFGHDVELGWPGHIVTVVQIYKKGSDYYIKYRDDETQAEGDTPNLDKGDKEVKEAKIWLEDGMYRVGTHGRKVRYAISERSDVNQNGVPDAHEYDSIVGAYCYYEESLGGDLFYDGCGVCGGPGAVYECGCIDIPEGNCDCDGNVPDECGVCGGDGIPEGACDCDGNVLDECGDCGGSGVLGCTNETACNYDDTATCDDGECLWLDACGDCGGDGIADGECDCDGNVLDDCGNCGGLNGCTYEGSSNYNLEATCDDGSCDFDECDITIDNQDVYDAGYDAGAASVECPGDNSCPGDLDGDGFVSTTDLLMFLSAFGSPC
jgi:hypothetical protein